MRTILSLIFALAAAGGAVALLLIAPSGAVLAGF